MQRSWKMNPGYDRNTRISIQGYETEGSISELEGNNTVSKILYIEKNESKKMNSFYVLWDSFRQPNTYVLRVLKRELEQKKCF